VISIRRPTRSTDLDTAAYSIHDLDTAAYSIHDLDTAAYSIHVIAPAG
jgi:hypothetical protein